MRKSVRSIGLGLLAGGAITVGVLAGTSHTADAATIAAAPTKTSAVAKNPGGYGYGYGGFHGRGFYGRGFYGRGYPFGYGAFAACPSYYPYGYCC